ncbi:hypothetical protein [Agromyces protaetiae]|uniref:hypothetical protein n=1 Tax=Agromyces protaetiae TaxID=2509455 RepID=UPI0013EAB4EA|nr:hypothetical protein [Agromyces protaetiae]
MNGIIFIVTMAIFLFGMWLMGTAPGVAGAEPFLFFGGILCIAIAVAIPVNVLGRGQSA